MTVKFIRIKTEARPDECVAIRYWYHVPRLGEYIDLGDGADGRVEMVFWGDDAVRVRFK